MHSSSIHMITRTSSHLSYMDTISQNNLSFVTFSVPLSYAVTFTIPNQGFYERRVTVHVLYFEGFGAYLIICISFLSQLRKIFTSFPANGTLVLHVQNTHKT